MEYIDTYWSFIVILASYSIFGVWGGDEGRGILKREGAEEVSIICN